MTLETSGDTNTETLRGSMTLMSMPRRSGSGSASGTLTLESGGGASTEEKSKGYPKEEVPSSSSTGPTTRTLATRTLTSADKEAVRVAFEGGGEVREGTRKTSSMDMTAAQFRMAAARERVHDRAQASAVQQEMVEPHVQAIRNPWNEFQHRHKGKGWSMDKMRAEYYKEKAENEKKHDEEKP